MIYIPVWLDQKLLHVKSQAEQMIDLHSSMVRLETSNLGTLTIVDLRFTFQYGQIRNLS